MLNVFAGSLLAAMKLLWILLFNKAMLATAILLWQHAICFNGLHRSCRLTQTLPLLWLELRMRLNRPYWVTWLSHLVLDNSRGLLPSIFSPGFLLCRDGQNIFDFFKTFALTNVSLPARA